jgi:zinc transport system substrate-binding protein
VFVYVGGTSDTWVESALKAAGNQGLVTVSMMDVCQAMEEEMPEGAEGSAGGADGADGGTEVEYDEHVWTSLRNDRLILQAITDALIQVDPDRREEYQANAAAYDQQLAELDAAYADMVAGAARNALLIADRYPFAYLMRDLGLTCYAAFPGCSSESQASFSTQVFLVEKVKELGLSYIFTVDNGQGSVAASVSQQTGATVLRLWSGQVLPEDQDMSYLDMLRENLENLIKALS